MSDSLIAKENIGYRKKRVAETSTGPQLAQIIQFAHKFTGGETSFNLLSLTTPTVEMPGFVNPSPAIMAGTGLAVNPSALRLFISITGGRMIPFESYKAFGSNIVFVGNLALTGMPVGAIVFGEIDAMAANPIVVGDGRFVRETASLADGVALVNTGLTYKVNSNPSKQIGDLKVYRNGVQQFRNVGNAAASPSADGNYQEIDAGNGYGTFIQFNNAASGQTDALVFEMGYQISSGQLQIWAEIERLQGAILALANDAGPAFGNPVTNYLSSNPSELDRRAFGDQVIGLQSQIDGLQTQPKGVRLNGTPLGGLTAGNVIVFPNIVSNPDNWTISGSQVIAKYTGLHIATSFMNTSPGNIGILYQVTSPSPPFATVTSGVLCSTTTAEGKASGAAIFMASVGDIIDLRIQNSISSYGSGCEFGLAYLGRFKY
jgi:hypothetical protein